MSDHVINLTCAVSCDDHGAYVTDVARIMRGEHLAAPRPESWPAPWEALARAGIQALEQGGNPAVAIEQAISGLNGDQQAIRQDLYAAVELLIADSEGESASVEECPPLPPGVQPDPWSETGPSSRQATARRAAGAPTGCRPGPGARHRAPARSRARRRAATENE